jgi:hypothetical protein
MGGVVMNFDNETNKAVNDTHKSPWSVGRKTLYNCPLNPKDTE